MLKRSLEQFGNWCAGWPPAVRFYASLLVALVIWKYSSSGLTDVLLWGATFYALCNVSRGLSAWRNPAGRLFAAGLLVTLLSVLWSMNPGASLRDAIKLFGIAGAAFAIPVVFDTRQKLAGAVFFSAAALTLVFAADILRLAAFLHADFFRQARFVEPFVLNHPNAASMMAGVCILAYAGLLRGRELSAGRRRVGWLGLVLCLFYLLLLAARGPQLAFAATLLAAPFLLPRWKTKLAALLIILAAGGIAYTQIDRINPRFKEQATMKTLSHRDVVWKQAVVLIRERPMLGHGFGKQVFEEVYYASKPPPSPFHYPHPHEYWMMLLFQYGWAGALIYGAAWLALLGRLARAVSRSATMRERALPAAVLLALLFLHIYGLADYPDNVAGTALIWLIGAGMAVTRPVPEATKA